ILLDLDPAPRAVRIGAAIGWPDLAIDRRLFPQVRDLDARDEIGDFLVGHLSGAGPDHKASHSFRMPRRKVQRGKPAAGNPHQMKPVELEMVGKRIEVAGNASRLWPG